MTNQSLNVEITPVEKTVQVPLSAEDAFQLFTQGLDTWWPLKTHSMGEEAAETAVFERRAGGRIYEIQKDGTRVEWGTVTAWEPPKRVVFTWHPGRGSETAQEVEVRFSKQGDDTQVQLIHRGWERLGEKGKDTRENYNQGWDTVLGSYVSQAGVISTG